MSYPALRDYQCSNELRSKELKAMQIIYTSKEVRELEVQSTGRACLLLVLEDLVRLGTWGKKGWRTWGTEKLDIQQGS